MDLSTAALGKSAVDNLRARTTGVLIHFGRDHFPALALMQNGCPCLIAARNLSAIVNREFKVADTRDLYERITPDQFAIPGLGVYSLAVLGACFQIKGIGGDRPLESWIRKHRGDGKVVTFDSLKHREQADARAERKSARRRKNPPGVIARSAYAGIGYIARQETTP